MTTIKYTQEEHKFTCKCGWHTAALDERRVDMLVKLHGKKCVKKDTVKFIPAAAIVRTLLPTINYK